MGFESVAGVIIAATSANGFPRGRFQWFGNESKPHGDAAVRFDSELLMSGLDANEVGGVAKVIAMRAQRGQFRNDFQSVVKTVLPATVSGGELYEVM